MDGVLKFFCKTSNFFPGMGITFTLIIICRTKLFNLSI